MTKNNVLYSVEIKFAFDNTQNRYNKDHTKSSFPNKDHMPKTEQII